MMLIFKTKFKIDSLFCLHCYLVGAIAFSILNGLYLGDLVGQWGFCSALWAFGSLLHRRGTMLELWRTVTQIPRRSPSGLSGKKLVKLVKQLITVPTPTNQGKFSVLHLIYILAFTVIAFLAVSNLIRSLISVSMGTQRTGPSSNSRRFGRSNHPELFDDNGVAINEPLLVMRSVNVEDERQRLDAIFDASPSATRQDVEEET